jgi:hypothetical protein
MLTLNTNFAWKIQIDEEMVSTSAGNYQSGLDAGSRLKEVY